MFSDFFDNGVAESKQKTTDSEQVARASTIAEALPEGFFDDPKMDAKVRIWFPFSLQ